MEIDTGEFGSTNNREFVTRYIHWLQDYEDVGNCFIKRRRSGRDSDGELEQDCLQRRDPRLGYTYRKAKDWLLTELKSALIKSSSDNSNADVDRWAEELRKTEEKEAQYLRYRDLSCTRAALAYYNKKHGADYDLVEARRSYGIEHFIWLWHHCNFTAARRRSGPGGEPPSPKLFFAELCLRQGRYEVKYCENLSASGVKIVRGCGNYCPSEICHPPHQRYEEQRLIHAEKYKNLGKNYGLMYTLSDR